MMSPSTIGIPMKTGTLQDNFSEIMAVRGIRGVVLFTGGGEVLYDSFDGDTRCDVGSFDNWEAVSASLAGVHEAEVVFDQGRIYIRRSEVGILVVVMDSKASPAMVKLNCDILLPNLKKAVSGKGIRRFFKR
jgi:hypothetical protein